MMSHPQRTRHRYPFGVVILATGLSAVAATPGSDSTSLPHRIGTVNLNGAPSFDSDSIASRGQSQWRWLSIPFSRYVINPASSHGFRPLPDRPDLPLHVGCYAGPEPIRLLKLLAVGVRAGTEEHHEARTWNLKIDAGREFSDQQGEWQPVGVTLAVEGGLGRMTVTDTQRNHGAAIRVVRPPFAARYGTIRIHVPRTDGAWALKINAGTEPDLVIQGDTNATGTFVHDLADTPGWQGRDSFDIRIFAIHPGKSVWVESLDLQLSEKPLVTSADRHETAWFPHKLTFQAEYPTADAFLDGLDYFHDENTIVRLLDLKRSSDMNAPAPVFEIGGVVCGPHAPKIAENDTLLIEGEQVHYAIAVGAAPASGSSVRLAPHWQIRNEIWKAETPVNDTSTSRLGVAVGFATRAEGSAEAVRRARSVFDGPSPDAVLARRKAEWDDWLRRVPAPTRYGIEIVDAMGITPEQHRRFYYGAWAFTISNILPPMPENDCPWPQMPTGKPSLWNYGSKRTQPSAGWDSFFGQQLLAYIMPDTAWDAFEGIMAQVDDAGYLDGESLPSRKAQTAWILHRLTHDKARLARVYPALKRYLCWREKNPRWIHGAHDHANEKDSSFVDHLLVDLGFTIRIAHVLGENADVDMWQDLREAILKNYREWFFFRDGRRPMEYYFTDSGERSIGHPEWVCAGLHIPELPADLAEDLKRYYLSLYDPAKDLAGVPGTKYPTSSYLAYGLIEHGLKAQAHAFINALLRDQIRAAEFAEAYTPRPGQYPPISPDGVMPSLFGVAQMIDYTLMNNGVRIDQGEPVELRWAD